MTSRDDTGQVLRVDLLIDQLSACGGQPCPMPAQLWWRSSDPYAVELRFLARPDHPQIQWFFARELLAEGLTCEAGWGDVRLRPCRDEAVLELRLTNGHEQARFHLSAGEVNEFVEDSLDAMPFGREPLYAAIDAELAEILGPGGAAAA